jgi:diacylglycerol kinase (ATP)
VARRILILVNPMAGRKRRAANRLRRVVVALQRHGCVVSVRETRAPGDAERLAQTADPTFDLIVAAGGDGTVNEVVNGLGQRPRPLAVLPLGTGNVLASEIGMPRSPKALAHVIAQAPARPIWPGIAGGRLFVAMTGIGFDAEVLNVLGAGLKRRIGKIAYAWAILSCVWRYRPQELIVDAIGQKYRAGAVIIVKGRRYAGNFVIAPAAELAAPTLQVVMLRKAGRLAAARGLVAMVLGALPRLPEVSILTARELQITAATDGPAAPCLVEIDGEVAGALPLAVGIAEAPLLLVQPTA